MAESQSGAPSIDLRSSTGKGPDALVGRVINDRFRVVSLIARGGMGKVYRAEQAPLGREVALKILNPNYNGDGDPEFHKRFFLEASTCSKLSHPNTVTIFDYGRTDDDVYYIAMELLEGRTLHRMLRDEGPFPPERAMHIARQVCRSLREAHGLGVIHRDLKPANVFLVRHGDENDFVKVLDFGLVKNLDGSGEDLTQTGLFMGSPKYMSPEQIRGESVDGRADIYALGVICYEMLTGKVPFDRPNSVNILMAHVHEPPPPFRESNPAATVPAALEEIVFKAMAKQPAGRFASMDEMLAALKHGAGDMGLSITRSTDLSSTGEFFDRTGQHSPVIITGAPSEHPIAIDVTVSPPFVEEAPPRKSPVALLAGIGAMLVLGALVAAVVLLSGSDEPVEPGGVTEPAEPVVRERTTTTPARTEPAIGVRTMVALRSTPSGATVRVGDQVLGSTPADVEWTGADATRGRQVTFVFQLAGHRDYSVSRVITGEQLSVDAQLEPIAAAPRPPLRDRRFRPREQGERVGPVKGYKLDPY